MIYLVVASLMIAGFVGAAVLTPDDEVD